MAFFFFCGKPFWRNGKVRAQLKKPTLEPISMKSQGRNGIAQAIVR